MAPHKQHEKEPGMSQATVSGEVSDQRIKNGPYDSGYVNGSNEVVGMEVIGQMNIGGDVVPVSFITVRYF